MRRRLSRQEVSVLVKGWFFEDFEVGKEIVSPGRTVTEADIVNFAGLTGDWHPLHTDEEYAKKTMFGRRIAHGALTFAIMTGLLVRTGVFEETLLAFYGIDKLRFTGPVYIGDTIRAVARVADREEKERGGLVTIEAKVVNQRNEEVLVCALRVLMMKKSEAGKS